MTKPNTRKIITANDLMSGKVIYLTDQDTWTTDRGFAEIFTTQTHTKTRLDLAIT